MAENTFGTDEVLWYNPPGAPWGPLGFAVPNWAGKEYTLNKSIAKLVREMGRNLQAIMMHGDARKRTPPSVNTLMRIHKLVVRARQLLLSRAVPWNRPDMESAHVTPDREMFVVFPTPYFKVRQVDLKEWGQLVLMALSEAMQHTENAKELEISTDFAGQIGQYLQRVYLRMATEFLMVPFAEASKPDFTLTDAHFQAYDPSKWFTSTELIDVRPDLNEVPTEDDLGVLTDGLEVAKVLGVSRWPGNQPGAEQAAIQASQEQKPATSAGVFLPPPGP